MSKEEDVPGHLPGMAPKRNVKIHNAAVNLNEAMEKLGEAREFKKDKEAKLIDVMKSEGVSFYRFGQVKCQINIKESVNVVRTDEEAKDDEDEKDEAEEPVKAKSGKVGD